MESFSHNEGLFRGPDGSNFPQYYFGRLPMDPMTCGSFLRGDVALDYASSAEDLFGAYLKSAPGS